MKKEKNRRPVSTDIDSLIMLHNEAADHLEMMHHLTENEEYLTGTNRDETGRMVMEHWAHYRNLMSMIARQDHMMQDAMEEYDMRKTQKVTFEDTAEGKEIPKDADRQFGFFRFPIFPILLFSLAFRHRRRRRFFEDYYRRSQFESYLTSTSRMECEHIAALTNMAEEMV